MMSKDSSESRFKLAAGRARRRFPDYHLDAVYPVCWPTYRIRLTTSILKRGSLSTAANYVLQLVDNGVCELGELTRLLCLPERYIAGATAELLRDRLVEQGSDLQLTLTEMGKNAIEDGGRVERLQTVPMEVPFDPLTRKVPHIGVGGLLKQDAIQNDGLFVVQYAGPKPGPGDLRLKEVVRYKDSGASKGHIEGDIIGISDIVNRNARLQYRKDIAVVKMSNLDTGESVFLAYDGHQYLEEETDCLQQLVGRGVNLVPGELGSGTSPWDDALTVSAKEGALLREIDKLDLKADEAIQDSVLPESGTSAGSHSGQSEPAPRTAGPDGKHQPAVQLAECESKLSKITDNTIRLIKTEEHHALLLKAIDQASEEITLVSAWIDPHAFDDVVRKKLAAALKRGVTVRIAWGLGVNGNRTESDRNRKKGKKALDMLRGLLDKTSIKKLIEKITNTHEKFIICDSKFCAWGSFNWLSYRGSLDRGYRRETSMYSTREDDIKLWKENASTLFQTDVE